MPAVHAEPDSATKARCRCAGPVTSMKRRKVLKRMGRWERNITRRLSGMSTNHHAKIPAAWSGSGS